MAPRPSACFIRSSIQCSHLRMASLGGCARSRTCPRASESCRTGRRSCASSARNRWSRNSVLLPGMKSLFEIESRRHRPLRIVRMDDGERDDDGARPRRHLVEQLARQQHDLRRNAGRAFARIEIEKAEIDLGVAVGRLNAAERDECVRAVGPCARRRPAMPASFSAK